MINKISTAKSYVEDLLTIHENLRDSDNKLIATIWRIECHGQGFKMETMRAYDFLKLLSENKLTSSEAIRRARQKIQEEQPELRGKKYNERHNLDDDVRENINEI